MLSIITVFVSGVRSHAQYNVYNDQGYTMLLEMGGMSSTNVDTLESFRLSMINGYQFSPHFIAGAGIGMDLVEKGNRMFPLFLDFRGILGEGQLKGMAYADFGYSIFSGGKNRSFGGIGIGGLWYFDNEYALSFSLGYEGHHVIDQVLPIDDINYIQLKIGLKIG